MTNIIEIKNLCKTFGNVRAVDGLDLSLRQGEIFGLIGPDGAGKTTTMRMLSGILLPTSGTAVVLGYRLPKEAEALKEHIGYMSQRFTMYTDLTVDENIRFFSDLFLIDRLTLNKRLAPLLEMTRLGPFRKRLAGDLSGGMKQKLALICTLIHRPRILFLDEPTTGVDPVSRREFWRILQSILLEGVSMLVTTPYMDEAEWCNRIGLMFDGRILSLATPHNLKKEMKALVVEVAQGQKDLTKELKEIKGLLDLQLLGNRFRLILKDQASLDLLKNRMRDRTTVRIIPPSVEDVFMNTILEKRNRMSGPEKTGSRGQGH